MTKENSTSEFRDGESGITYPLITAANRAEFGHGWYKSKPNNQNQAEENVKSEKERAEKGYFRVGYISDRNDAIFQYPPD